VVQQVWGEKRDGYAIVLSKAEEASMDWIQFREKKENP
jgi:hypothetical protein